jgi:hypothetical protein
MGRDDELDEGEEEGDDEPPASPEEVPVWAEVIFTTRMAMTRCTRSVMETLYRLPGLILLGGT